MYKDKINQLRLENPFLNYTDIMYDLILEDIIWDRFEKGVRLKESTLAEECKISRTPVKEALNRLYEEGFLTKSNLPGYEITPFDITDYADFCTMRQAIEPVATYYAARFISDQGRMRLKETMRQYEEAAKANHNQALHQLDAQFHKIIIEESRNRYFIEIYEQYEKKSMYFRTSVSYPQIAVHYNVKKHSVIYQKIIEHDEQGAADAMRAHLSFTLQSGVERLKRRKQNI